ncbi:hypothetical protein [Mucilaginibacter segetis]|uniref:YXWGXW repeat-containing protein n=1 Tax=Mucilaginibacter segetis TaxID=2793071 RepID=A0A934UMP8_9SPHI|nr:hypothetical protein [Mucilaginibacter segetis]MBK0379117.1 hypothetical protein [Mucilaginibacter segetis]
MKKIFVSLIPLLLILTLTSSKTKAQVSVDLHIGAWNPPVEYASADYYYLPDIESYYYVPTHQFVFLINGQWVFRNTLPYRYRYYNINNGYKVAVYRPHPYRYFSHDRRIYAKYRGNRGHQVIIRDHYRARPNTRVVNRTRYTPHNRTVTHTRVTHRSPGAPHSRTVTRTRVTHAPNHHTTRRVTSRTHVTIRGHGNSSHGASRAHTNGGHGGNRGHH